MHRILHVTLALAVVAGFAVAVEAADLGAPPCGGAALQSLAEPAGIAGLGADDLLANDLEAASEPQPLAGPFSPVPQQCGLVTCPAGTRCCNPLCSACTPPGVECTLGDCGHGNPAS